MTKASHALAFCLDDSTSGCQRGGPQHQLSFGEHRLRVQIQGLSSVAFMMISIT